MSLQDTQGQNTQAPTGFTLDSAKPPLGSDTPPKVAIPGGPLVGDPQLPGTDPTGPVETPKHWDDRVRIIALILALYDQDPAEAIRVGDLVESKLNK